MRSHSALPLIAFALALLAPAAVMAQLINGDDILLTDSAPEIAFSDTDGIVGFNWSIRGYDENFRIVDTSVGTTEYLNINPGLSSLALGAVASASADSSMALGVSASSGGNFSAALGYAATSNGPSSIALGREASSVGVSSTALGQGATSVSNYSIALGYYVTSNGFGSTALGFNASTAGDVSIALGWAAYTAGDGSIALGRSASSLGDYSVALGYEARVDGAQSIALGAYAFAGQHNTVILGSVPGVNGAFSYANVGIGTSAPSEAVDVQRSAAAARFQLSSFTDVTNEAPQFIQRRARGTSAAPTAVQNNDNLGLFSFRGHNGTVMGGSRATITAQAAGNFSGSSTPTRLIFSTTPVGSTTPQSVLVITPDGKVQVKGVNLNVPDYVFEDDYELMPLQELQTFIDENGHLPGMPSADEVNAGVHDLAGSDMAQLQKIEELTLYTLQLQDQVRQQQARIAELETLQDRVAQLEMRAQNRALTDHD